ncbi:major facilitator super transporter protein [Orbilia oligospora]|uniref:GPI ethanolamine phosphate transferase 2 n=2 Tax=Orbilia oligospora TaxID=2813651 RepID=A0A7C8NEV1_ORBOL|nr:major facilitator super transporter protein [Orbilia oligospora]KAF3106562.1 major facilitator super transporter protein [Orbilia oligospora]
MVQLSLRWLRLAAGNLLLVLSVLVFAKAFFPYKPFLQGLAQHADYHDGGDTPAPAQFEKIVFMLVDALRSDFVFGEHSGFEYTQSLIRSGVAIPFTAHATSPTITMPKIKALTTGSIPGFLDLILNFAESDTTSTLATQDNWLAQIKQSGKKLIMFGDDTWLKLFPGIFERTDGTVSFFVSDFTEVDNNVTRHVAPELQQPDWDAMILHYLGLDHIGHKTGPRSQHMIPKQHEMDGIVKQVYHAIETEAHLKDTLFVLVGDHGMNDGGGHGGSSSGETSAALVFMSPKLKVLESKFAAPAVPKDEFTYHRRIEQSDVAPTLTTLLGLPIPKNNLGLFIQDFLPLWDVKDQVKILNTNGRELSRLISASYSDFDRLLGEGKCNGKTGQLDNLACMWHSAVLSSLPSEQMKLFSTFSSECQDILTSAATNYDTDSMLIAIIIGTISLVLFTTVWVVDGIPGSALYKLLFWALSLSYSGMMIASSYVEEEQQYWYWAASGWGIILLIRELQRGETGSKSVILLVLLRLTRRWNQTGQKHAGAPDITNTFLTNNPTILWALVFFSYTDMFFRLKRNLDTKHSVLVGPVMSISPVVVSMLFKLSMAALDTRELIPSYLMNLADGFAAISVVTQAQLVFSIILLIGTYLVFVRNSGMSGIKVSPLKKLQPFHDLLTVFIATQSRLTNIPLIWFFNVMLLLLDDMKLDSPLQITLTVITMQHVSFFALGNSNAISSVDLSNAYNGVSGFNVGVVGILTFLSNWAGPVLWTSGGVGLMCSWMGRKRKAKKGAKKDEGDNSSPPPPPPSSSLAEGTLTDTYLKFAELTSTFRAVAMVAVMGACMVLRMHLFVWTVFSPKYLFAMVWTCVHHIIVDLVIMAALHYTGR